MTLQAPPKPESTSPEAEELEALIEEARERARRRRWMYAAALAGASAFLLAGFFIAGGGGGDEASQPSPGDPPSAGAKSSSSSEAEAGAFRCPSTLREFRRATPGKGVGGCMVTVSADLPAGWDSAPRPMKLYVYPLELPGAIGNSSAIFASFPVGKEGGFLNTRPRLSAGETSVSIGAAGAPTPGVDEVAPSIDEEAFKGPSTPGGAAKAGFEMVIGAFKYDVLIRSGVGPPDDEALAEINSLLASLSVEERLPLPKP